MSLEIKRLLNFEMEGVYRGNFGRGAGFSVRCVED